MPATMSEENQRMFDRVVQTYRSLYWFSTFDLPNAFCDAVMAYERENLESAFSISNAYICHPVFLKWSFESHFKEFMQSPLIGELQRLHNASLLSENFRQPLFNLLAKQNKSYSLARIWINLAQKNLLVGDGAAFYLRVLDDCSNLKLLELSCINIIIADNPLVTTADHWALLGEDYYEARNGKVKDLFRAKVCYEYAIKLDINHVRSLYRLGLINQLASQGLTYQPNEPNPIDWHERLRLGFRHQYHIKSDFYGYLRKSREYYQRAATQGHYDSKKQLLILDNPQLTVPQWHELGDDYYYGRNDKQIDLFLSRACFEHAIDNDSRYALSLYKLGWIHEHLVPRVDENFAIAFDYYQRAVEAGDSNAKKRLFILDNAELTADQWFELGDGYYHARDGQIQDYSIAYVCFNQVIQLNPNHSQTHLFLGEMYQHGRGVAIDLSQAKEHYEKSFREGCSKALNQLLLINNPTLITADSWYNLGQNYYLGRNGKTQSDTNAIGCFELASQKDETQVASLYSLGVLFQYGQSTDLIKAKEYYERAVAHNHEPSRMQLLIINHPNLRGITNQHSQIHVVQLELILKKIASYYPWVCDDDYSPNLILEDMEDLSVEMDAHHRVFEKVFNDYKASYEARVNTVMNIASTSTPKNYSLVRKELIESAQALWKFLKKYSLQITKWQAELLGHDASPCLDQINTIDRYIIAFEQRLGELSDMVPKIPVELGGRSDFFSLGHYLSTLSSRYSNQSVPISSYISKKIDDVQKILSHPHSSERICLGLVFALIREIAEKQTESHFLALLCVARNYAVYSNPCDSEELQSITQELHLTGAGNSSTLEPLMQPRF